MSDASTGKRIRTNHVGIYYRYGKKRREGGTPDRCFDIIYRSPTGKLVFEKVGWESEGYTLQDAVARREQRIHEIRSPEFRARKEKLDPMLTGKRVKTNQVGVYYRYGKDRFCADGKPDKCFDITYRSPTGKLVFEKIGWKSEGYTLDDAVKLRGLRVRETRHSELSGKRLIAEGPAVDDAWDLFKTRWLPNFQPRSQYGTERIYHAYIKSYFGHRFIRSITSAEIEKYKQELLTAGIRGHALQPSTVMRIIGDFKRILNKTYKWNVVEGKNPLLGVTVHGGDLKRERYLTEKEADLIFDGLQFVSCDLYRISRIALCTGMRLSEILGLRGSDIHITSGTIQIKKGKTGNRTAYIPDLFTSELSRMIPKDKSEFLFRDKKGQALRYQYISTLYAWFIEQTGLNEGVSSEEKIVFHTFRHTFCSWLAIAGVPLYTIAKLAGHKTLSMTQRYAKLSPDTQKEALNRLPVK